MLEAWCLQTWIPVRTFLQSWIAPMASSQHLAKSKNTYNQIARLCHGLKYTEICADKADKASVLKPVEFC